LGYLARDSIYPLPRSALYTIVRLSVSPSHGWITQKRLKLRITLFSPTVAPSLQFCGISFI